MVDSIKESIRIKMGFLYGFKMIPMGPTIKVFCKGSNLRTQDGLADFKLMKSEKKMGQFSY
jgi:hypothetical protein